MFFYIGKPGASVNYVHVYDVVEGLVKCGRLAAAENRVYNLSDYLPLESFINIIASELHKESPTMRVPEAMARTIAKFTSLIPQNPLTEQRVNALVKRAKYSTQRIQDELNFTIGVPLDIGIRQLINDWADKKST
jgi:nucleoside-diphosphate-sugar epimerase